MTAPERIVVATDVRLYDRIFHAGRWRAVINADLKEPPTDEDVARFREAIATATDDLALRDAAFSLGYAIQNRLKWPKRLVYVTLGTAGGAHYVEYPPEELVTVRRPG